MKMIIYITLSLMLMLTCCRATNQTTKSDTTVATTVQADIATEKSEATNVATTQSVDHRAAIDAEMDEITTIITLSPPDSAGNQYPTAIALKNTLLRSKGQSNTTAKTEQKIEAEAAETTTDNSTSTAEIQSEIKERTKERPTAVNMLMTVALVAGLLLLILYGVRRLCN